LTNVLGFKLDAAVETLREQGFSVELVQVRSRKGVPDGDDPRVIGQKLTEPNRMEIRYAVFRTRPEKANA
jgi:hypothetical protein